jgi:hypothetical protein
MIHLYYGMLLVAHHHGMYAIYCIVLSSDYVMIFMIRVPIYSPDNPNGRRGHGLCTVTTPSAIGGTGTPSLTLICVVQCTSVMGWMG